MSLQNSANSMGQFSEKIRNIVLHVRQIGFQQSVFWQIVPNPSTNWTYFKIIPWSFVEKNSEN